MLFDFIFGVLLYLLFSLLNCWWIVLLFCIYGWCGVTDVVLVICVVIAVGVIVLGCFVFFCGELVFFNVLVICL